MAKVGRNAPCPCQSGKKYKHCHGSVRAQEEAKLQALRAQAFEHQRQKQQGWGKAIISTVAADGTRFVAVGKDLLPSKNCKTVPDFLIDYLKTLTGAAWGQSEMAKPPEHRHPIISWYQSLCEYQKRVAGEHSTAAQRIVRVPMIGAGMALYQLAYDLYALAHNAELQKKLINRLKDSDIDNFHGARFEAHVGAIFVRAGFSIEFEDEDDRNSHHHEFIATHNRTGRKFCVEAKRRNSEKERFGRLFQRALRKDGQHERIVFIDLNYPDNESKPIEELFRKPVQLIRRLEGTTPNGKPLPNAFVFLCNIPWVHAPLETGFRRATMTDGFQIPDYKYDAYETLREAINAREKYIELHELMQSNREHTQVPQTFDGDIPDLVFSQDQHPRLLIGNRYAVEHNGEELSGVLEDGVVITQWKRAQCILRLDNGIRANCTWPLSDEEMAAYAAHPETFFGVIKSYGKKISDPLELYDFNLASMKDASIEQLRERLSETRYPINDIGNRTQEELASIYAERLTIGMLNTQQSGTELP